MTEHGADSGEDFECLYRHSCGSETRSKPEIMWLLPVVDYRCEPRDGCKSFQSIRQQDGDADRFAEYAHGIGRADVPAADGADVDAPGLGSKVAGGDRAEQIRAERGQDVAG